MGLEVTPEKYEAAVQAFLNAHSRDFRDEGSGYVSWSALYVEACNSITRGLALSFLERTEIFEGIISATGRLVEKGVVEKRRLPIRKTAHLMSTLEQDHYRLAA